MATIAASEAGIEKAKEALIDKGWSRQDLANSVVLGEGKNRQKSIDIQTVNKFFTQKPIRPQYFVGICKALELNWQDITNPNTTTLRPETGFFHENTSLQSIDSMKNPASLVEMDLLTKYAANCGV